MKRLVWLPVAGFLLVAGAAVAAAAPGTAERAAGLLAEYQQAGDADADQPSPAHPFLLGEASSLLDEVLVELVDSGVLTQEQADAVTSALKAKADERRAEFEAERERLRQMWEQVRSFLADGVITADEIDQLPEDNPFSNLEQIMADGQITVEEIESIGPFGGMFRDGMRDGPAVHFGPGPMHPDHWFGPDEGPEKDPADSDS